MLILFLSKLYMQAMLPFLPLYSYTSPLLKGPIRSSSCPLMENWVPKSDSSVLLLDSESIGDSETDLVTDNDMVSDAFDSNFANSEYDDDAESTSEDNSCATDDNVRQDIARRKMLCKGWWYDLYDAKNQSAVDHGESIEEQIDSGALVAQEEMVLAQDDAESNRLFWDACIAHGY
jgi:hypothetical protein